MLDDPLAVILKRLRKEESIGNKSLNTKRISISSKKYGKRISPLGHDLKINLEKICGSNLQLYSNEKNQQLRMLGFEERPFELEMSIEAGNIDGLVDTFLGIKTNVSAKNINHLINRFGIKIKDLEISNAEGSISIIPDKIDTCTILFREEFLSEPESFNAEIFLPAIHPLPLENIKILFRSEFFQILMSYANSKISFFPETEPLPISKIASLVRVGRMFGTGKGFIEILSKTGKFDRKFNINNKISNFNIEEACQLEDVCGKILFLARRSGCNDEPKLKLNDINNISSQVEFLYNVINGFEVPEFKFSCQLTEKIENTLQGQFNIDLIYVDHVEIGDIFIGCYGVMKALGTYNSGTIEFVANCITLKKLRVLSNPQNQYKIMINEAKQSIKIDNIFVRGIQPNIDENYIENI